MNTAPPDRSLAGLRILIVEDENLVGILIEELLQDAGAQVRLAETLDEAHALIGQENFDGVLLDINLGSQTTDSVADALAGSATKFIVMTGCDNPEGNPPALQSAPRLLKPFKRADLLGLTAQVFGGSAAA